VNPSAVQQLLSDKGWAKVEAALAPSLVAELCADLARAHGVCREVQVRNGLGEATDGAVHHIIGIGESFFALLEDLPIWPVLDHFFGGKYILNSFGGVVHVSGAKTYLGRVHRDIRTFSGRLPLMMNILVMLDRFTPENGATYLLERSHLSPDRPDDATFFSGAVRAVGPPGTVVLFNSNLWHAAGENQTGEPRRALTLTVTPPYLKQQCDYPRLLGYDRAQDFSPRLRQLLGYNARIPASLDEWYQPAEKRLYQRDQG
jgi:hypothetical protein